MTVRTIVKQRFLSLMEAILPDGTTWEFVTRQHERGVEPDLSTPDTVTVVPTLVYPLHRKLLMIREFRPIVNKHVLGFPSGCVDKGETTLECAVRELYEETELTADRIRLVGPTVVKSPGLTDETAVVVRVEVYMQGLDFEATWRSKQQSTTEDIQVILLDYEDAVNILERNDDLLTVESYLILTEIYNRGFI